MFLIRSRYDYDYDRYPTFEERKHRAQSDRIYQLRGEMDKLQRSSHKPQVRLQLVAMKREIENLQKQIFG